MLKFDELANKADYEKYSPRKKQLLDDIKQIVINSKAPLEGNYFYSNAIANSESMIALILHKYVRCIRHHQCLMQVLPIRFYLLWDFVE